MATFFKHENRSYPLSLSDRERLSLGKKSDLLLSEVEKEVFVVKVCIR